MIKNLSSASKSNYLRLFAFVWALIIIAPLVYFPAPSALFGHPWKVELAASFLLCIISTYYLIRLQKSDDLSAILPKSLLLIILPFCLFIIWSGLSVLWAGATLSVLHHTLVWFCYLIFFLFAGQIVSNPKYLRIGITSLSVVIGIISLNCIIEYVFEENIGEVFGFRYARFAEINAAILPLFFSFILRLKNKHLIWAASITVFVWLAIIFSTSRGALLSAVIGLFVFIALRIFSPKSASEKKRLIPATLGIIVIAFLILGPIFSGSEQKSNTASRLVAQGDDNPNNTIGKNIRFLFTGVALEMISENKSTGIGADNFGLEFNKYRALYSADKANESIAGQQEELIAERAHNEYLQILAELGIIGGVIFLCFIFGIVCLGFGEIKKSVFNRSDILSHSAIAGMTAFLISSTFSSFSFRLMQNGIVFFFLAAILFRKHFTRKSNVKTLQYEIPRRLNLAFAAFLIIACFSLTVFSTLKATSQFLVYKAEQQSEFETAKFYYEKAFQLDPANASANYLYGLRLLRENYYSESAVQLQKSIQKGLHTTICYSYLISSQTLAKDSRSATQTASEAVSVFPYSVFMRVRYAALLKNLHNDDEAAKHLEIAKQINSKQAETWRLLISEGALLTSQKARGNDELLNLEKLNPNPALYAVLTEREILFPQEKTTFDFSKISH